MANNYVTITLDTTPPTLIINMSNTVQKGNTESIIIISSENIGSVYELYIIDSNSDRYDLTFSIVDNLLFGSVNFNYELGLSTLYVRVRDDVLNLSSLYSKQFTIVEFVEFCGVSEFIINLSSTEMITNTIDDEMVVSNIDLEQVKTKTNSEILTNNIEVGIEVECNASTNN